MRRVILMVALAVAGCDAGVRSYFDASTTYDATPAPFWTTDVPCGNYGSGYTCVPPLDPVWVPHFLNQRAGCIDGRCVWYCSGSPYWADCDRDPRTGCESDLYSGRLNAQRHFDNCGQCGRSCTTDHNGATLRCVRGECVY